MSTAIWDKALDEVLTSLLSIGPEDMDKAESHVLALRALPPAGCDPAKLKQVRAAAVNAMQLWRSCLPEPENLLYSPAGEAQAVASRAGISVTA